MSQATPRHDRSALADSRQIMHRCSLPSNVQDGVYPQGHVRTRVTVKPGGLLPKGLGAC